MQPGCIYDRCDTEKSSDPSNRRDCSSHVELIKTESVLCQIAGTMDCSVDAIASFFSYYEVAHETRSKFVAENSPKVHA